jgi:hypothetical protein
MNYRDKDWLYDQYWNKKKSLKKIGNECNVSPVTIQRNMIKFDIPRRTNSDANKGRICAMKGKNHSLETRLKMSKSNKDKKKTEEHKKNMSKSKMRELNPNWKGGVKEHEGYILKKVKDHPYSCQDYVYEHRLVIESFLKQYLDPKAVVHHINEIKNDNRLSNLMLFKTNGEHLAYHGRIRQEKICTQAVIDAWEYEK